MKDIILEPTTKFVLKMVIMFRSKIEMYAKDFVKSAEKI